MDEEQIKETIEKELLLSKAYMNLGEWNELNNHFSKINQLFNNKVIEEQLLINKKEELFINNYIKDNNLYNVSMTENDEKVFFINHGLNNGINMSPLEKDFINLNQYIFNYNKRKIDIRNMQNVNQINQIYETPKRTNSSSELYISFQELVNNNQNLSFFANNEEILFDLNLYSAILNIENEKYNLALNYISEAKKIILSQLKSLLNESYIRGYDILAKNQMIYNLENIIDYKQNHFGDKLFFNNMVNEWDKKLDIIEQDVVLYEKLLAIRSLVIPIDKDYTKYMNLVKICRKLNLYGKSEKILLRLKNKLNIFNDIGMSNNPKKNEIQIQMELSYNKCLFKKGKIHEAIERSKKLINLLESDNFSDKTNNLSELSNKIKSQVYRYYAIYKHKNFVFSKGLITNLKKEEYYKESNLYQHHNHYSLNRKSYFPVVKNRLKNELQMDES